jgi:hypothetical protein
LRLQPQGPRTLHAHAGVSRPAEHGQLGDRRAPLSNSPCMICSTLIDLFGLLTHLKRRMLTLMSGSVIYDVSHLTNHPAVPAKYLTHVCVSCRGANAVAGIAQRHERRHAFIMGAGTRSWLAPQAHRRRACVLATEWVTVLDAWRGRTS